MMLFIKKYKYILTIAIFITIFVSIIVIKKQLITENDVIVQEDVSSLVVKDENVLRDECIVDVKGAVYKPGIYSLECNKRVSDAIILAGGITDDADTSKINLAKLIYDEMVIIVYVKKEIENTDDEEVSSIIPDNNVLGEETVIDYGELININLASVDELKKISGIGAVKAMAIIDYRNKNGLFHSIQDIKNVPGIGDKLYEKIKIYITT